MTASKQSTQTGAALLVTLMMLIVIMLLGTSATQMSLMNEKSSRNLRNRQLAFEAAEAALIDGADDIFKRRPYTETTSVFPSTEGTCGANVHQQGLCLSNLTTPLWQKIDLRATNISVAYGRFSGRTFSGAMTTSASSPITPPRYLIELLRFKKNNAAEKFQDRYRITAIGFGSNPYAEVVLQAVYDSNRPVRLSWREIANWQEIYNGTGNDVIDNDEILPADFDDL